MMNVSLMVQAFLSSPASLMLHSEDEASSALLDSLRIKTKLVRVSFKFLSSFHIQLDVWAFSQLLILF